jgi:hypothetical protein
VTTALENGRTPRQVSGFALEAIQDYAHSLDGPPGSERFAAALREGWTGGFGT